MTAGPATGLRGLRTDHVSRRVPDYDVALSWYRNVLGLPLIREWTDPELPGLKLCTLALGGTNLELIGDGEPAPRDPVTDIPTHMAQAGVVHLCLVVDDLEESMRTLRERGVEELAGPVAVPALGMTLFLIKDASGNAIEIAQQD